MRRAPQNRVANLAAAFEKLGQRVSPAIELVRLAGDEPQCWATPLRDQYIADGLVEVVVGEDQRWRGDRLTAKGRELIGEAAT